MREALFSQDGWGCQHVNQDTNWEVPSSPEPTNKDPSGPPMWKPTVNNGTDLWESNLRNGGQPPTQQVQKPSWGHTPTSNLGGTWGEDDDGADSSNVWTGNVNNPTSASGVGVGTTVGGAGVGAASGSQWGQGVVGMGASGSSGGSVASGIPGVASGGSSNSSNVNTSGTAVVGTANTGNGWGDPREMRSSGPMGGGQIDIRSVDPRDPMRSTSAGDPRDLRLLDPRDPIRGDPRGISGRLNGTSEMWGHHQQISHNQMPVMNKMVSQVVGSGGTNVTVPAGGVAGLGPGSVAGNVAGGVGTQWGTAPTVVGPKDINKQVTGWEEPSPPPQRRNIPNYDDGTSLWGQQTRVPGGSSHWKDMDSINRSHIMRSQNPATSIVGSGVAGNGNVQVGGNPNNPMAGAVGPQARLATSVGPNSVGTQHKPDGGMWVHSAGSGRNPITTWSDDGHNVSGAVAPGAGWVDDKTNTGLSQIGTSANSWNDSPSGGWNSKQNKLPVSNAAPGWSSAAGSSGGNNDTNDINVDWATHSGIVGKQQQQKLAGINVGGLNLDIVKQSKQYRILVDTGFKKDDVERALISANMNIEEAAEILRANSSLSLDGWRRHEETLGSYDHANSAGGGGFPGRYTAAGAQPSMSFPPNNLLNNLGGSAVTGGSNNPNMAALQVQKYLNQGPHAVGPQSVNSAFGQGAANSTASVNVASNTNNQPSAQQLRMLVQQIQLAVHSGFLSSQILNQPLAPATLILLNQLLSNIKHLQAAQQQQRGGNANPLAVNVAIAKYKQQIQNLQNQINAQQAIYIKQQQQQNLQQNPQQQPHPAAHLNNTSNEYMRGHDAISALQGNFSELNLNKQSAGYQGAPNQQSRLNQWKLPVLEKDMTTDSTDFSRAPGATKQSLSATNSNNIGPLGLQNDGTWSAGRNLGDGWPDPSNENESKDWSVAQPSSAAAYTDLVQEFEPGKPWKGSQIKNIEDDPSITPGSVARSPLSINPTPKDADIFVNTGKNSPTDLPPLSLSSSTWSFNPNQNFPSWSDNPQQVATSELWASSLNKSSRGPPPGLSANKTSSGVSVANPSAVAGNVNGWLTGRGAPNTWAGGNSSWSSNWLLLKNLSAQIDGSTLRTLCMQHGPLISFHLYLIQGIALCKYATREEASKAQMTLNNCVLGNTTIFAESPNESEVQNILQHLPQTPTSNNPSGTPGGGAGAGGGGGNGNGGGSSGNITGNNGNNGSSGGSSSGANSNLGVNTGGNGNSGVNSGTSAGNSNVGNNNTSTGTTNSSVNGAGSTNSSTNGKNTSICGNNSTGGSAVQPPSISSGANVVGNNTTWRQTTQNQTQQNQTRPTGRETEFDFSQYVCSIVDD